MTSTITTLTSTEPRTHRRQGRIVRFLAAALLVAFAFTALGQADTKPASAINPAQTTAQGVLTVQAQWYGGVNDFWARQFKAWGRTYYPPKLYWYDSATRWNYNTGCGSTATRPNNGFYCGADHAIYLDKGYMQSMVNRRGDYAAGGFMAHEWGHAIARLIGYRFVAPNQEYLADCLAGMSTRWGYETGRLVGSDYGEFFNWLAQQPTTSTHGTGANRSAWYKFGYQQYNINQCARAA